MRLFSLITIYSDFLIPISLQVNVVDLRHFQPTSTKVSVCTAVICSTLTEEMVGFSGG